MSKEKEIKNKSAIVIGSGFGGLALAIRLQAMGFVTTIVEKLDKAGGRAYQKSVFVKDVGEFKFDMGPTVLTVPHFIEELFSLKKGDKTSSKEDDYTKESLQAIEQQANVSNTKTEKIQKLEEILKKL